MIASTTKVMQPTHPVAPAFMPPVSGFSRFRVTVNDVGWSGGVSPFAPAPVGVPQSEQNFASG